MFMEWKGGLEEELEDWRNEVSQLSKGGNTPNSSPPVGSGWLPVSASTSENVVSRKPSGLWTPDGEEIEVEHWNQVLVRVVEWLIENGRLSEKEIKKDDTPRPVPTATSTVASTSEPPQTTSTCG